MCQQTRRLLNPSIGRRRQLRGFGLFDALISMAVLAFGLLAMTRFQSHMVAQATESQSRQMATQLAAEHLSTLLVDLEHAPCYTLPQAGNCTSAGAKLRTAEWAGRVATALPAPVSTTAALDAATSRMTLTINWIGKDSGDTRTLQAVTDVRQ